MRTLGGRGMLAWLILPFWHASGRAALFFLIALINPFEIVDWSEQRSHDFWQRIYSHCYARVGCSTDAGDASAKPKPGRDAITVVYFDDDSLARMRKSRPLPAFDLSDLIDDIRYAAAEGSPPRAIFVDMLLADAAPTGVSARQLMNITDADREACKKRAPGVPLSPFRCLLIHTAALTNYGAWAANPHCQDSTLAKIECIRKAKGLVILYADPRERDDAFAPQGASPALETLGLVAATVPVSFSTATYSLVAPSHHREREHRRFELYPAAALYAAFCASGGGCPDQPAVRDDQQMAAWSKQFDQDLDVIWGIGSENQFTRNLQKVTGGTLAQQCAVAEPGLGAALGHLAAMAATGVTPVGKRSCIYSNAAPFDVFQASISPEDMAALVSNKIVLIGGQFSDSNDLVRAPPFGSVPGVYFHAMALDNLIERGPAYPKPLPRIFNLLGISWFDLFIVFLISLGIAVARSLLPYTGVKGRTVRAALGGGEVALTRGQSIRRRALIVTGFAAAQLLLLFAILGGTLRVPDSFNLVAATLICLLGTFEVAGAAAAPVWDRLKQRLTPRHLWVLVAAETDPLDETKGKTKSKPKGKRHGEGTDDDARPASRSRSDLG